MIVVVLLLILSLSVSAYAYVTVPYIDSPLSAPQVYEDYINDQIELKVAWVVMRSDDGCMLYNCDIILPAGSHVCVYAGHDQGSAIYSDKPFVSGTYRKYNVSSGVFLFESPMALDNTGDAWPTVDGYPYRISVASTYWPKRLNTDNCLVGFYAIVPEDDNITVLSSADHYADSFVIWSPDDYFVILDAFMYFCQRLPRLDIMRLFVVSAFLVWVSGCLYVIIRGRR